MDSDTVERLLAVVLDDSAALLERAEAAVELRGQDDARVIDALLRVARDISNPAILRIRAIQGLEGAKGENVVDALIGLLGDSIVSSSAVTSLLSTNIPLERFTHILQHGSRHARTAVIEAIRGIGGAAAMTALINALTDVDYQVREATARALVALGWKPEDNRQRALALGALRRWADAAKCGSAAQEAFIIALSDSDDSIQWDASQALTALHDPVRVSERLIADLRHQEDDMRLRAARALRWIDISAVESLLTALTDHVAGVRYAVCESLTKVRDVRVTSALEVVALNDENDAVRQAAAKAIQTRQQYGVA